MPVSEWNYDGHKIRVITTHAGCLRLYADGELLDSIDDVYASGDGPILIGVYGDDHTDVFITIDVFIKLNEVLIRVNGEWITGNKYAIASD